MTYIDPTLKMNRSQAEEMLRKIRKENNMRAEMKKEFNKLYKTMNRRR
ncbi:MAG: hypothetical protein ACRC1P_09905 [Cellulosilyticaceae bacterium]